MGQAGGERDNEITVERSFDYPAIQALARHPKIFRHITDDFFPTPESWQITENEQVVHLLASDPAGEFGFGIFMPENWACWRAHFGFLPVSYGSRAQASFQRMLAWMWANTTARRIVGEILAENRRAISFAQRAGCEIYGVNVKSKLVGGVLRDQACLGISKP